MNDVQAWQATYARHERTLARERKLDAARVAEGPSKGETFAAALPAAQPVAKPAPAAAAPEAATLVAAAKAKPAPPAPVDMTSDQLAMLMTAFGSATPVAKEPAAIAPAKVAAEATKPTPTPATAAAPELTADQAALLLQSFGIAGHGYGVPQAADVTENQADAAPEAAASTAIAAADSGRFFPINSAPKVASADASDAYLGAIQNMERNLARYSGR